MLPKRNEVRKERNHAAPAAAVIIATRARNRTYRPEEDNVVEDPTIIVKRLKRKQNEELNQEILEAACNYVNGEYDTII